MKSKKKKVQVLVTYQIEYEAKHPKAEAELTQRCVNEHVIDLFGCSSDSGCYSIKQIKREKVSP